MLNCFNENIRLCNTYHMPSCPSDPDKKDTVCLLTYSTNLQTEHTAEAKRTVSGSAYQVKEADVRVEINSPYLSAGLPRTWG